jgi:peptidyl-Lys metalloendopeptidase
MKSKYRFNALLFALLAALLITTAVGAAPKGGAVVSLSVEQGAFDSAQDVFVTVNISNPTNHTVRILKWFTPVQGVEEPLFAVMRDGEPVSYIGALYKRPAVTGQDYISLKSGESITSIVNLGDYYDLSEAGEYEIFYAVASFNLFEENGNAFKFRDSLVSEKISVSIHGQPKRPPTPTPPPPGGIGFNRCTVDQQSLVTTAHENAKTYASESEDYLFGINAATSRYNTWFGAFTTSRYNTVKSHFTAISDAFDTAPVTYDCGCKQNYYAYVYPNQPYKIYLCKVFWTAPMTGTDSKAGTLIHEMSHFNVVAGTDDFVYGQVGAKNLAISNPDNAVMNADNHEYFAENTPALP